MKQRLVQIGLIVVILVALGFVFKQLKPKQYSYERLLVDVKANKVFIKKYIAGKDMGFPTESPFSEGKNSYPVMKCVKDGTIFAYNEPMNPESAGPSRSDMPKCPVCGGFDVILPELPSGQTSMDVPGPIQVVQPSN